MVGYETDHILYYTFIHDGGYFYSKIESVIRNVTSFLPATLTVLSLPKCITTIIY